MKDNLFDRKWTALDVIKIFFLIVSAFSTWNIVDMLTPESGLSFIRQIASVAIVEGVFVGFEYATWNAKNKKQTSTATLGFYLSVAVIGLFAATSGLLEFGGEELLDQPVGAWAGIAWKASDVVTASALAVFVTWLVALASLFRYYELNDPDKQTQLATIELMDGVAMEARAALRDSLSAVSPIVAKARTLATINDQYAGELSPEALQRLTGEVTTRLTDRYATTQQAIPADPNMPIIPAPKFQHYEPMFPDGTPANHPNNVKPEPTITSPLGFNADVTKKEKPESGDNFRGHLSGKTTTNADENMRLRMRTNVSNDLPEQDDERRVTPPAQKPNVTERDVTDRSVIRDILQSQPTAEEVAFEARRQDWLHNKAKCRCCGVRVTPDQAESLSGLCDTCDTAEREALKAIKWDGSLANTLAKNDAHDRKFNAYVYAHPEEFNREE